MANEAQAFNDMLGERRRAAARRVLVLAGAGAVLAGVVGGVGVALAGIALMAVVALHAARRWSAA